MIHTLYELGLLDSPSESSFDNLTKLASSMLGTPVSLVSILDFANDRQFFKSQIGLDDTLASDRQTPLSHSFCQHVVLNNKALVVENASEHPLVKDNEAIQELNVAAYLGIPVHSSRAQPLGALCVIDTTPREWTDNEIELLEHLAQCVTDVIDLKSELLINERLRQEQRDFAYAISHDLKAPIATLKMLFLDLLEGREELTSNEQETVDSALGCADRMTTQIESVLRYTQTLNKAESYGPVDLNSLCSEVLHDLQGDVRATNAHIDCEPLPPITADRAQMKLLLQNLISNALKYQPEGQAPVVRIHATTDTRNRTHEIHVTDNGIGIATEDNEQIFKIFGRLHTQDDYPGSGVGLTLCRRVAVNHGGSLLVSSVPGGGSTFTLRLSTSSS